MQQQQTFVIEYDINIAAYIFSAEIYDSRKIIININKIIILIDLQDTCKVVTLNLLL